MPQTEREESYLKDSSGNFLAKCSQFLRTDSGDTPLTAAAHELTREWVALRLRPPGCPSSPSLSPAAPPITSSRLSSLPLSPTPSRSPLAPRSSSAPSAASSCHSLPAHLSVFHSPHLPSAAGTRPRTTPCSNFPTLPLDAVRSPWHEPRNRSARRRPARSPRPIGGGPARDSVTPRVRKSHLLYTSMASRPLRPSTWLDASWPTYSTRNRTRRQAPPSRSSPVAGRRPRCPRPSRASPIPADRRGRPVVPSCPHRLRSGSPVLGPRPRRPSRTPVSICIPLVSFCSISPLRRLCKMSLSPHGDVTGTRNVGLRQSVHSLPSCRGRSARDSPLRSPCFPRRDRRPSPVHPSDSARAAVAVITCRTLSRRASSRRRLPIEPRRVGTSHG